MDNARWKVVDPLGNEIYLTEDSFKIHIVGDHKDEDAIIRMSLEEQVKKIIPNPCLILKHDKVEGRRVYLDWGIIIRGGIRQIRPLFVVTESYGKVVTWFSKRTVNINVSEDGGIIYDRRISDLQVRQEI